VIPFFCGRLRKVFQRLIAQKSFDYLLLCFIALNCITLAMERPSISPISFVCNHFVLFFKLKVNNCNDIVGTTIFELH